MKETENWKESQSSEKCHRLESWLGKNGSKSVFPLTNEGENQLIILSCAVRPPADSGRLSSTRSFSTQHHDRVQKWNLWSFSWFFRIIQFHLQQWQWKYLLNERHDREFILISSLWLSVVKTKKSVRLDIADFLLCSLCLDTLRARCFTSRVSDQPANSKQRRV